MKTIIISVVAALLIVGCSDEKKHQEMIQTPTPLSWQLLEEQTQTFATGVQNRDLHVLHQLDRTVSGEIAGLQKLASTLTTNKQQQVEALLADLEKQAARAHHNGHADNWDDVVLAQKQFTEDVKAIQALIK